MNKNRYFTKDGCRWTGGSIVADGRRVFNPSREQLMAAGYTEHEAVPYVPTLEEVKAMKVAEIEAYDVSEAVNGFVLDGETVWLPYELRSKIGARLPVEAAAGRSVTTLWLGTRCYELPIALAERLLGMVELYAADCYDATSRHKAAVEALGSAEEVEAYDYTAGYPERPVISTREGAV